jgi:hypothetical protein
MQILQVSLEGKRDHLHGVDVSPGLLLYMGKQAEFLGLVLLLFWYFLRHFLLLFEDNFFVWKNKFSDRKNQFFCRLRNFVCVLSFENLFGEAALDFKRELLL